MKMIDESHNRTPWKEIQSQSSFSSERAFDQHEAHSVGGQILDLVLLVRSVCVQATGKVEFTEKFVPKVPSGDNFWRFVRFPFDCSHSLTIPRDAIQRSYGYHYSQYIHLMGEHASSDTDCPRFSAPKRYRTDLD